MSGDCDADVVAEVIDKVFVDDAAYDNAGNAKFMCFSQRIPAQV